MTTRLRLKTTAVSNRPSAVFMASIWLACAILLPGGLFAMAVDANEGALSKDLNAACGAIQAMKENADYTGLVQAMKEGPLPLARIAAIEALAESANLQVCAEMVDFLESRNYDVVEGGSEQQMEHKTQCKALVDSISRILRTDPPLAYSTSAIAEFIIQARAMLKSAPVE